MKHSQEKPVTDLRRFEKAKLWIEWQSANLFIPQGVSADALKLYRQAMEKGLTRHFPMMCVATALLYIACRLHKLPRTVNEINGGECKAVYFNRVYRFMRHELCLQLPPVPAIRHTMRFCSMLDLNPQTRAKAVIIARRALDEKIAVERSIFGIISAAIYLAAILGHQHQEESSIGNVVGISEVTMRKITPEIVKSLYDEWLASGWVDLDDKWQKRVILALARR
jgi:transcription initiation factor TFIIB